MEKRHIPILNKVKLLVLGIVGLSVFTACTQKIPEGDIKDFVELIRFTNAQEHVVTGISQIQSIYSVEDEEKGRVTITTQIDQRKKYYYSNTEVSGSYVEEYTFHNQQVLSYVNSDDTISSFKKTDDVSQDISYNLEEVYKLISTFFYTKVEGGYHQGAVYYGDYVVANCAKFYSCFSLNEEKTILTYQVNTSQRNEEGDEILTMHYFTVDAYGMILSLHTKSMVLEKNIVIDTTIECSYNTPIEKKLEL
ncbi:MAG: hypothetical protein K2M08_01895 [Anaeroplasmataceae bacterium]|nr:hypothetical protein [Anaeroplasmataceae bacterium]MDE6241153.1 hypothetical protein [Anaeroplasmataceae bacterium]